MTATKRRKEEEAEARHNKAEAAAAEKAKKAAGAAAEKKRKSEEKAAKKAAREAEKEAKRAAKAARQAEIAQQKKETALRGARLEAATYVFDRELLDVESAGSGPLYDTALTAAQIQKRSASEKATARMAYHDELTRQEWTRDRAAWAARKILRARQDEKATIKVQRAAVNRAANKRKHREAMLLDLLTRWAHQQERETEHGFRMREANLRIEVSEGPTGPRVIDAKIVCDAVIRKEGMFRALDLGLVRTSVVANPKAIEAYMKETGDCMDGASWIHEAEKRIKIVPMGT